MNDLISTARRLREYADEHGISDQKREDLLAAVDVMRIHNAMLNAARAAANGKDSPIPG